MEEADWRGRGGDLVARVDSKESRMEKRMMEGKTRNRDEAGFLALFPSLPFPFFPFPSLFFPFLSFVSSWKNERRDRWSSVRLGPGGARLSRNRRGLSLFNGKIRLFNVCFNKSCSRDESESLRRRSSRLDLDNLECDSISSFFSRFGLFFLTEEYILRVISHFLPFSSKLSSRW